MNIKRLTAINDVAKEDQTDELKMTIYRQIEKFVYKYHTHYYPHYQGELNDLVVTIFTQFCTPKKHRNGEVFSELDRVDPGKVGGGEWKGDENKAIATYVQRYVIARLIDMERTDKREVRVSENYDENNPGLTVDRAVMGGKKRSGSGDDGMVEGGYTENISYDFFGLMDNPQAIANAKRVLLNNPAQVKRIKQLAKHYEDKLDPQVKEFIVKILGEDEEPINNLKEIENTLTSLIDGVKVSKYSLQNKPALKVSFVDKEAMSNASEHKDKVIKLLETEGYEFYKAHGANWYFFQANKVGDSVQGPKNGQKFRCIKDVPNPSGYGLFCKEGEIVSCDEDDYLVNSEGLVYKPYKYSMQEYFELDEVDDSMQIVDATSTERFNSLVNRVGDKPQHYLNQINKCGPDKKVARLRTFYKLAKQNGLEQTAEAIKTAFPEEYSPEEIENAKKEELKRAQAKKQQEKEAAKQKEEASKQEALNGGKTYCNVSTEPGRFMSSPDNIFTRFAKKHPTGYVIEVSGGDASVGAPYERRDGRVWTIANKYTVSNGEKTETFDIANLTNEGYNPSVKSGWDTDASGKKWFVGSSFGWLLNGSKMKFSELKASVERSLESFK